MAQYDTVSDSDEETKGQQPTLLHNSSLSRLPLERLQRAQSHYQLQRCESSMDILDSPWEWGFDYTPRAHNAKMRRAI